MSAIKYLDRIQDILAAIKVAQKGLQELVAIQDELLQPVRRYEGCYCNVVGLPLWTAAELLRRAGVDITHISPADLLPQCASCPLRPLV